MAKEKDLSSKSTLTTSDYIRVVGSDNASYKQPLLDVGSKGQIGQIGLLSDKNLDNFATNNIYGTWWLNCTDSAVTGTKPSTTGNGLLICKQQYNDIYKQVYVGIADAQFKFRNYANASWTAWEDAPLRDEVDALQSDSGWITLVSGVKYRKVGQICYVNIEGFTATQTSGTETIGTLPSGYRPTINIQWYARKGTSTLTGGWITSGGNINYTAVSASGTLAGFITFPVG